MSEVRRLIAKAACLLQAAIFVEHDRVTDITEGFRRTLQDEGSRAASLLHNAPAPAGAKAALWQHRSTEIRAQRDCVT